MKWESQQLRSLTIKNHFTRQWNSNIEIPSPEIPVEAWAGFEPTTERDRSPELHRGRLFTDVATGISIQCRTGINKISAELKHEGEALDNQIYKLTIKIWRQEEKPEDRETRVIVPVHKKGEKRVVKITEI